MKDVLILLSEGNEEIEALTPADYLRRAGLEVDLCSLDKSREHCSSHGIRFRTDVCLEEAEKLSYRAVFLPGGLPGALRTAEDERVQRLLQRFHEEEKWIFAICAGPVALRTAGLSARIKGCCYPGFEDRVSFREAEDLCWVQDGKIVTARGVAMAAYLALRMIRVLKDRETAEQIAEQCLWPILLRSTEEYDKLFL